ncbi:hypothetical protein FALBO_14845 [Fusarium albosuccineum]|uniref:inorganic diphosphatase n=1 Tax=Fusarium albosuccineum TaxID=1237068 RepID=A0A8H4KZD0_9HYPO|nr:hypothetical protein FALBO_14845 [Fusarium albosuccineum]
MATHATHITQGQQFFTNLDQIYADSSLVVDRAKDTKHPRIPQAVYPVDYGYLEGTTGGDGQPVDVFRGSAKNAGVVGVFLTADREKHDVEVKVLLDCTDEEIDQVRHLLKEVLKIGGLLVRRDHSLL